jgi:serine/threonine protein kinase
MDRNAPADLTLTLVSPPSGLSRGVLFAGRYEVIEELGRGGMGRVYKVYDQKIKEVIALKLIHPEISVNEKAIDRFRNELRFARKIGHRHVCRMFDLGEEDHKYYITMEYVEGENLKSFIRRSGQLAPKKAISLAKQVCEGLAEAHRLGIVHRDLKPHNVMIDREGNARIMDFGIARFAEAEGLTGSGVMVGTPEYMSPEQAETVEVDKRADIYALGVILYEMVTGRVPFAGETPLAVIIKHKQEPPRNPQESNPLVSDAVTRIILKCLAKDREARYQDAEELLQDLTLAEARLPQAERSAMTGLMLRARRRVKWWLWAGAAVVAALAAGLVWLQFLPKEPGRTMAGGAERGRRIDVSGPPQPPPVSEPTAETALGEKAPSPRSVLSLLTPDALRRLSQKDIESLLDFEKQMANIEGAIPRGAGFDEILKNVYQKVREGRKLNEEGRAEEARKMRREGQDEMQKLLTMVAHREGALEAKSLLVENKTRLRTSPGIENNVLYRVASRSERDAESAFDNGDFSGSRALCSVLAEVFGLSGQCSDAAGCLKDLALLVASMRSTVSSSYAGRADPWLSGKARDFEGSAQRALAQNDFEGAAEQYVQAAFLYQKMIDSLSSK